jgi:hypothetical protein
MRSTGPAILNAIRKDKQIKPETEEKLKAFVGDYAESFK